MKKYELTDETKIVAGCTLHKIKALKLFGNIKEGELGGWVENEENLSHKGNCWVFPAARVYDNARVTENAWVYGNARVFGGAWVCQNACVCGGARVCGEARVYGNAQIAGHSCLSGDTLLKFSRLIRLRNIKLYHGTWEAAIEVNAKKYLVSNMLDLYEVPG